MVIIKFTRKSTRNVIEEVRIVVHGHGRSHDGDWTVERLAFDAIGVPTWIPSSDDRAVHLIVRALISLGEQTQTIDLGRIDK